MENLYVLNVQSHYEKDKCLIKLVVDHLTPKNVHFTRICGNLKRSLVRFFYKVPLK